MRDERKGSWIFDLRSSTHTKLAASNSSFLPSRFSVEGNAIDAKGFYCHSPAWPNCHLTVPRALVELQLCLNLLRLDNEAVAAAYEQELDWRFATAPTPRSTRPARHHSCPARPA